MTEQLLTPAEAGGVLAMTKGALAQLRYMGTGPSFVRVSGRSIRYRQEDLDTWIRANVHGGTRPESDRAYADRFGNDNASGAMHAVRRERAASGRP